MLVATCRSRVPALLLLAGLLIPAASGAQQDPTPPPQPPCAGAARPAYAAVGQPPAVQVWREEDWQPPDCLGWQAKPVAALVGFAASFEHAGDVEALLARLGAIDDYRSIRYWSITRDDWRPLFEDVAALTRPDPSARRADFAAAELAGGGSRFLLQNERGLVGEVVQRLEIREVTPERLVFAMTNVTAPRVLLFSILEPGDSELVVWLERAGGSTWHYYSLMRLGGTIELEDDDRLRPVLNRALAGYRYLAGIPTDRDPPLAP